MEKQFNRLVKMLDKSFDAVMSKQKPMALALRLKGEAPHVFGQGEPSFTLTVNDKNGIAALASLDGTTVLEAYMNGSLDFEGDLMSALALRNMFKDKHRLQNVWRLIQPLFFGQVKMDKKGIAHHYDDDPDFYTSFLDADHRCYSQGVFLDDSESLEAGIRRKLDFAIESTGIKAGDSVLDIGAGWGAFVEYGGGKGINVTSLTISDASEKYVNGIIREKNLPCKVIKQHLLEYKPKERYDAIVNMGVTEHLPDYRATLAKYAELLKPKGRVYLDASAGREKNEAHSFVWRHIFPGNGSFWCLHDYLREVAATPFRIKGVYDDTHSYYLTTKYWAERLDSHREEIVRRWGEFLYRKFRIYLWGSAKGFLDDSLQAYRLVLELP